MSGTIAPCKHCQDRTMGCHGLCSDYNNWVIEHNKEMAAKREYGFHSISQSDFGGAFPRGRKHARTRKF